MSTSVLEAVACRDFVITTKRGGAREIILDDTYGMIMDNNNLDTVERALEAAALNPELRETAVELAYKNLQKKFTWDIVADKVINLRKTE